MNFIVVNSQIRKSKDHWMITDECVGVGDFCNYVGISYDIGVQGGVKAFHAETEIFLPVMQAVYFLKNFLQGASFTRLFCFTKCMQLVIHFVIAS